MKIRINGSLGDEVALTGVLREYRRWHPDERLVVEARHPEVFLHLPALDGVGEDNGRTVEIPLDPHPFTGSFPYAYGVVLGVPVIDPTPEVRLVREDIEALVAKVSGARALGDGGWIAIDTWAGWPRRRWPFERWQGLVDFLNTRRGVQVVEVGKTVPDCLGIMRPLDRLDGTLLNLVDVLTVRETAVALSKCSVYVGSDSGLAHLAAAVGTPAVVLYAVPWWSRAYPSTVPVFNHRQLVDAAYHGGMFTEHAWLECASANLDGVTVEQVKAAVLHALARGKGCR